MIPDFCKRTIAGFKVPKNITFIKDEEMPKTPTGKILHRVLREVRHGEPFLRSDADRQKGDYILLRPWHGAEVYQKTGRVEAWKGMV